MKIIDSCIVEGTGKVTQFDKAKLVAGLGAMDPAGVNQVFDHIVGLQHFYDRFSNGYWTDEERFLSPAEVGKNVLHLDGSLM